MKKRDDPMSVTTWISALGLLLIVACYDKGAGTHLLKNLEAVGPVSVQGEPAASRSSSRPASRPAASGTAEKEAAKPGAKRRSKEARIQPARIHPVRIHPVRLQAKGAIPSNQPLIAVLSRIVHGSRVDYGAVARHRAVLDAWLAEASQADLAKASNETKLAFYINAYNISTLTQVLDKVLGRGPKGGDLAGVLAVKGKPGFFDTKSVRISGEHLSLNELEAKGRALGDPRIHFAVNCASISCPALLNRPWEAATLDKDLDLATRRYFASKEGLVLENGKVKATQLLNWYAKDFGGKEGAQAFLEKHAPESAKAAVKRGIAGFLPYNWALNRR